MKNVCINCHQQPWVDNFYVQYDGLIEQYHSKFAMPGKELYELAKPLLRPVQFSNELDLTWYEIWHHEGRRARHGGFDDGPRLHPLARHLRGDQALLHRDGARVGGPDPPKAKQSGDAKKAAAAEALEKKLDEVLNSPNHRWYLDKMDPAERQERQQRQEEFKQRYAKEARKAKK